MRWLRGPRGHRRADGRQSGGRVGPADSRAQSQRYVNPVDGWCGGRLWGRFWNTRRRGDLRAGGAGNRPHRLHRDPALSDCRDRQRPGVCRLGDPPHALSPRPAAADRCHRRPGPVWVASVGCRRTGGSGVWTRQRSVCRIDARAARPVRAIYPLADRTACRGGVRCHRTGRNARHPRVSRAWRDIPRPRGCDRRECLPAGRCRCLELVVEDRLHRGHARLGIQGGRGDPAVFRRRVPRQHAGRADRCPRGVHGGAGVRVGVRRRHQHAHRMHGDGCRVVWR